MSFLNFSLTTASLFTTAALMLPGCGYNLGIGFVGDQDGDGFNYDRDCNDRNAAIHPNALEIRHDLIDQNCNGMNDEDQDGDGQTVDGGDCEDSKAYIFARAIEFRDSIDNNCNGIVDENNSLDTFVLVEKTHTHPSAELSVLPANLNSDKYSEILVGVTEADGEEERAGAVELFSGIQNGGIQSQTVSGDVENDRFGTALAAGDMDGDGILEVAVGAKGSDEGGTASGSVLVFSGPEMLTGASYDTARVLLYGSEFTYGGSSLAYTNSDGDDVAELLVGGYGVDGSTGAVWIMDAESLQQGDGSFEARSGLALYGHAEDDRFGSAVAGGADLDGDGIEDFAVGAPQNSDEIQMAGAVYVYLGRQGSYPADYDFVLRGEGEYDNAGYALAVGSDVDGDGFADLLVGAPGNDGYGADSGRVYVVRGREDGFPESLKDADAQVSGATEAAQLGLNVAMAGDVNADGFGDFALAGLVDDDLLGNSALYLFLGSSALPREMTTSQADAVFVAEKENVLLVTAGGGDFDGQSYDGMGPYADLVVAYSDTETNETQVFTVNGQETKP